MASGRVGGTKSKISGQVGGEVYKVVKNADGSYSQVVTIKGETTVNRTTPRLQAQRMVTAMVESLMRDLAPVAKISFQSGANKSKSLNAFSSYNLRLVAQDCKANWYGGQKFIYPTADARGAFVRDLGGPYMISSGTLQWNAFDSLFYDVTPRRRWVRTAWLGFQLYGLKFSVELGRDTFGSFLRRHSLTLLDSVVLVGFRQWYVYNEKLDELEEMLANCYAIFKPNPSFPSNTVIDADNINSIFVQESDLQAECLPAIDGESFAIGWVADVNNLTESFWYYAAFTISYIESKKKVSTSFYEPTTSNGTLYQDYGWPSYVFGSWMGEFQNHDYPSPFV